MERELAEGTEIPVVFYKLSLFDEVDYYFERKWVASSVHVWHQFLVCTVDTYYRDLLANYYFLPVLLGGLLRVRNYRLIFGFQVDIIEQRFRIAALGTCRIWHAQDEELIVFQYLLKFSVCLDEIFTSNGKVWKTVVACDCSSLGESVWSKAIWIDMFIRIILSVDC